MAGSGRKKAKARKPKKSTGGSAKEKAVPPVASARTMERVIGELSGSLLGGETSLSSDEDLLARAQDLIYDAWEKPRRQDRIRLAEEALTIYSDCADAYNLLAEEKAENVAEARAFFASGLEAAERALGEAAFEEYAGHFWGLFETRPYMRARAGLAQCLWTLGEEEEAIGHYEEMLRLNPNDNQGIRHVLLGRLLERDDEEKAGRLLEEYAEDGSSEWLYGRALWLFRREKESTEADSALAEALEQNPYVPMYLLGEKKVPNRLPDYIGWGDKTEAQAYAAESLALWKGTEGARGWLLRRSQKRS